MSVITAEISRTSPIFSAYGGEKERNFKTMCNVEERENNRWRCGGFLGADFRTRAMTGEGLVLLLNAEAILLESGLDER